VSRSGGGLGLLSGFVLLTATGFTDAYTFLRHGHVFAEAMTGNLVLVGVGAVAPAVVAFWRPLVSYLAFLAGVVALWLTARRRPTGTSAPDRDRALQLSTLGVEVVVLTVVGFLPHSFPQELIVASISFAAGLQISAFRRIERADLSTVVMTTNSMQAVGAALEALGSGDELARARARGLLVALVGFVAGVFLGAVLSSALHDQAAWVVAGLFFCVAVLYGLEQPAAPGSPHAGEADPPGE